MNSQQHHQTPSAASSTSIVRAPSHHHPHHHHHHQASFALHHSVKHSLITPGGGAPQHKAAATAAAATFANGGSTTQQAFAIFLQGANADDARQYGRDFAASWLAIACSLILMHPVDTLRVRKQTSTKAVPCRQIIARDGVRSLYCGFATPLVANGPVVANAISLNEYAKTQMIKHRFGNDITDPNQYRLCTSDLMLATGAAGCASTILQCPVDVLRIQQQVSLGSSTNAQSQRRVRTILEEMRTSQGSILKGLYRGFAPSVVVWGSQRMIFFTAYDRFKDDRRVQKGATLGGWLPAVCTSIVSATMANCLANALLFPVDCVKTRVQSDGWFYRGGGAVPSWHPAYTRSVQRYNGALHCAGQMYRLHGVGAFTNGLSITMARCFIGGGFAMPLFDFIKETTKSW